jgi:hypothetical protein
MSTKSLAKLAVVLVQVSLLPTAARSSDKEFQGMTIRIIDGVGVPATEWQTAQLFADKILRTAGVSVTWVRCLWNPRTGNTDCPATETPNQINLVVLSEQSTRRLLDHANAFGMALETPNGSFASRGYIFYGRIQNKCAEQHDINEASLLGAVVVHEIGHLLLGPNSHSSSGIMKPAFDRNNTPKANLSVLQFDRRQSEALRVAVTSRVQAAHSQRTTARSYMTQASTR